MNRGVFDNIVDSAVRMYVGYGQIHTYGYWEDKTIDNVFTYDDSLQTFLEEESLSLTYCQELNHTPWCHREK